MTAGFSADLNTEKMSQMIQGYWISQIIGTLAWLGIPDHLAGAPLRADELAELIDCHPGATYRLMRAAKMVGLVVATSDGRFSLTSLGEILRSEVPSSMRDVAIAVTGPAFWLPMGTAE
jgi:Dimerisation domain